MEEKTRAKGLLSEYQPKYNSARAVYRERKKYVEEIDWNLLAVPPSGSLKTCTNTHKTCSWSTGSLLDYQWKDFGYVQTTSTKVLKSSVFNEPIMVDAAHMPPLGPAALFMQGSKRMPGTAVTKSVVANEPRDTKREEIFVDIIEKISVTFSSSASILSFTLSLVFFKLFLI